mgnify:CR=1 FL=1
MYLIIPRSAYTHTLCLKEKKDQCLQLIIKRDIILTIQMKIYSREEKKKDKDEKKITTTKIAKLRKLITYKLLNHQIYM